MSQDDCSMSFAVRTNACDPWVVGALRRTPLATPTRLQYRSAGHQAVDCEGHQMGFVEIDGQTIHYHEGSDPSVPKGQRVLYVHGTGCNARVWAKHMAVVANTHTPVAIDLPGHGQSGGDGFRGMADYAYYASELATALSWERFVVAGHSMGGGIALNLAIYHADRLSGMMLIDTGARLRASPSILQAARQAAQSGQRGPADRTWGYARNTPQSIVEEIHTITADCRHEVRYKDWICDDTFDVMSRIGAISVPTLAVCGVEDNLTPVKYHTYFRDQMPDCQLEVIEGAGHWPYFEQPKAFNDAVLSFLDGLPIQDR